MIDMRWWKLSVLKVKVQRLRRIGANEVAHPAPFLESRDKGLIFPTSPRRPTAA